MESHLPDDSWRIEVLAELIFDTEIVIRLKKQCALS